MSLDLKNIKNIIFDLGGVLINIDTQISNRAFEALSRQTPEWLQAQIKVIPAFFKEYEKGTISKEAFVEALRQTFALEASSEAIIAAWNAMILDFLPERIQAVVAMRKTFKTFLLSNSNAEHIYKVEEHLLRDTGYASLQMLFDKVYYSHEVHLRKPDAKIYEQVLQENQLKPEETLFIDDAPDNIAGAEKIGIVTWQAQRNGTDVLELYQLLQTQHGNF
ncbi:MAG: HAD family phosphatase [Cytophagales bacterium]|nr:MAG: HAD family phosphatase [Cytophagales bacterium]